MFGSLVMRLEKNHKPDQTLTNQDRKYVRLMRTETTVQSLVHPNLEFVMTDENQFGLVLTGLLAHKFRCK